MRPLGKDGDFLQLFKGSLQDAGLQSAHLRWLIVHLNLAPALDRWQPFSTSYPDTTKT